MIETGRVIPFVITTIVMVSYVENVISLSTNDYVQFYDGVYLNKEISWFISDYFRYDIGSSILITTISFAIETCVYNKLCCGYIFVNLLERDLLQAEMSRADIYIISLVNILISFYLIYKGFGKLKTTKQ